MKNAHQDIKEHKETSLNALFDPVNSLQPQIIQCSIKWDQDEQQIFMFEDLEQSDIWLK